MTMQAIVTRYHAATNTKPSYVSARSTSGLRVSLNYEHEYTADAMHRRAAQKLCNKYGWPNELLGGGLSDSEEVWVLIPRGYKLVKI